MLQKNQHQVVNDGLSEKNVDNIYSQLNVQRKSRNSRFPIVAMGGSAGSFQAFEKFFSHLPEEPGMAFIIIMHLDPKHAGNVSELVQRFTALKVVEAEDGMKVEPEMVYIIPPNKDMGIHNRKLLLLSQSTIKAPRLPIDYFFHSLAEDQWNKAVAIIFSGMGSDGETGIRMIKEKLGMTMVQNPETAQYNSMPRSAIATNMVDYVLSPEEMPVKIIQYLNHPVLADHSSEQAISETKSSIAIQKILMLLRSQTSHDFSMYKKSTITRRIDRRIAFYQLADYDQYVDFLRENSHEIQILLNELLIGVTKFFRDTDAYAALNGKLFHVLKNEDEPVRVWIAGCSTGEEAYSIAIMIVEQLSLLNTPTFPKVQIFATDLDIRAIEHARLGIYRDNIVADVSEERLERFFERREEFYAVKKELREMIVFAQHNLIKDAPFTRLDLISCRNVLIYLNGDLQRKIIPIFHYSLNVGGLLFLGPAETLGGFADMFTPIDPKWKLFERKNEVTPFKKMVDFPFSVSNLPANNWKNTTGGTEMKRKSLSDTVSKVLIENYTPTAVLINEKGDIIYIHGKTNKFLELHPGEASMNILRMAREELKYALSNAIHVVRTKRSSVTLENIKVKDEGSIRVVDLKVDLLENNALEGLILILFVDKGMHEKEAVKNAKKDGGQRNVLVDELEKELLYTKEQLHTTIEQMETSMEELKSTNEELQSTNEELQSTNEEALTTKEEMQSLNEELMTINYQYQSKAEELTQVNNDMKNMLDSTEIGTIFLNNNLQIVRFTPQIKKIFNVIEADLGRSISHIASNFDYPSLEDDIHEVIEKLLSKEVEVKTKNKDWFKVRIMPYRTTDNFINGAVLTINRITHQKDLENKVANLTQIIESVINLSNAPSVLIDPTAKAISANKAFHSVFRIKEKDLKEMPVLKVINEAFQSVNLEKFFKNIKKRISTPFYEVKLSSGKKDLRVTATPFIDEKTKETLAVLIVIEEKDDIIGKESKVGN